jgi:DNA polymerase
MFFMNKIDLKAALEWQIEMGVDDSFSEQAEAFRANSAIPSEGKAEAKGTRLDFSASLSFGRNDTEKQSNFSEPQTANFKPQNDDEMAKAKNKVPSTKYQVPESEFLNLSNNEWVKKAQELANACTTLEQLKEAVTNFDGLAIKKSATNCVFGEGNTKSKVMFIGEAPGENEDLEARPFCGVSGQLLDKMLKQIGLKRSENFYITNTIFWRPPGNRKPTPEELAICKPFVEKHIALINPKVIVLVGATATAGVLNSKDSISQLRKVISQYQNPVLKKNIPCFAIYHPSYLLRSPSQKKVGWEDLIKLKKYLSEV